MGYVATSNLGRGGITQAAGISSVGGPTVAYRRQCGLPVTLCSEEMSSKAKSDQDCQEEAMVARPGEVLGGFAETWG